MVTCHFPNRNLFIVRSYYTHRKVVEVTRTLCTDQLTSSGHKTQVPLTPKARRDAPSTGTEHLPVPHCRYHEPSPPKPTVAQAEAPFGSKCSLKGYKYLRNRLSGKSGPTRVPHPPEQPPSLAGGSPTSMPGQGGRRCSPTWATTCSCARRGRSCGGHRSNTWRPGSRSNTRRGRRRPPAGSWTRSPAPCRR